MHCGFRLEVAFHCPGLNGQQPRQPSGDLANKPDCLSIVFPLLVAMSNSELNLASALPVSLYEQFKLYQQAQSYASETEALADALQNYFDHLMMEPDTPDPLGSRIEDLEKRLSNLTREVLLLRQELPNTYDRLREQLATVRLSHSGLLQDLRGRVQALEAANQAPPPLNPEGLPFNPSEPDDQITGDLSL